jgi:hypothetical protein
MTGIWDEFGSEKRAKPRRNPRYVRLAADVSIAVISAVADEAITASVIPGRAKREPGISRFRVWC